MNHTRVVVILGVLIAIFSAGVFALPEAEARSRLDVATWIPWWQEEEGTESAKDNLRDIDTIHPFVYEVNSDGTLKARAELDEGDWRSLIRRAKRRDIEVIPTVMWFDGQEIHEVLSDRKKRRDHIDEIVDMVDDGNFDGVDIDYESKLADTIDYFSLFLRELEDELGRDLLTCTVEARTPPESLYRVVPENIRYANDYKAMNRYCDRIELMTYDQQRADLTLNSEKRGEPYIPVADVDWVEKVVEFALEDIDEDKIMLGVPTYGREWTLTVEPDWFKSYAGVQALNMPEAEEIAEDHDVRPGRNKAGELSYSYFPEDSVFSVLNALPTPEGTRRGFEAAAKALMFANATNMSVPVNIVWYSDAKAIEDKVELAEKYDLRGIAIFKTDGEEDPDIWDDIF